MHSGNVMNAMTSRSVVMFNISIRATSINTQKIDGFAIKTYETILAGFWTKDKVGKIRFFDETFLITNTSMEIVIEIDLLAGNYLDISFSDENISERSYCITKILPTAQRIEQINKHEFHDAVLDKNSEILIILLADSRSWNQLW